MPTPKGTKLLMRLFHNVSKMYFIVITNTFKITGNKVMVSTKVWSPSGVYSRFIFNNYSVERPSLCQTLISLYLHTGVFI